MKIRRKKGCLILIISILFLSTFNTISNFSQLQVGSRNKTQIILEEKENDIPKTSSSENYETIDGIFNTKLEDFATYDYFPEQYEASLQATYYALYILDALGYLNQVNHQEIIDYIMRHYDPESHMFMDTYAYRYLGDTASTTYYNYYTYNSVLEINCYAILSLYLLGRLDLIHTQDAIDFIWSCLNPENSTNGFIGQPYNPDLRYDFKLASMQNTYFAVQTLDILMEDWTAYSSEKARIVQYINMLQCTDLEPMRFGGFWNDCDENYQSLEIMHYEPSLLSSYYCIKSLEILDLLDTIRLDDFHNFLSSLYEVSLFRFQINDNNFVKDRLDLIATALAISLADDTGFMNYDREECINYILNNRNSLGVWSAGVGISNYELIDTFQIIRSLNESNFIESLDPQVKNEIMNGITYFRSHNSYALLSQDYSSMQTINSITNAFHLHDRISDLAIPQLYEQISRGYFPIMYGDSTEFNGFLALPNIDQSSVIFRSLPLEYFNWWFNPYLNETNTFYGNKYTYFALDTLNKIFKLDDFHLQHNLLKILTTILNSQLVNSSFKNYGAFMAWPETSDRLEKEDDKILFEHSYYAVRILELITDFLDLGPFSDLLYNRLALIDYIEDQIAETPEYIYLSLDFTTDKELILENTYFMIYMLKALNLYSLDSQKVHNYLLANIDYENIKNIYYCYKISQLIDLDFEFNFNLTRSLIQALYCDLYNEFYIDTSRTVLTQEAFLWIAEMALDHELEIECHYIDSLKLGSLNTIYCTFRNMFLDDFGPLTTARFESNPLGTIDLERQANGTYMMDFLIPEDPICYPRIDGELNIRYRSKVIGTYPVHLDTDLVQTITHQMKRDDNIIHFEVNISRKLNSIFQPVSNSVVYVEIFKNNAYLEAKNFTRSDNGNFSRFTLNCLYNENFTTFYNVSLIDSFYPHGLILFEYEIVYEIEPFSLRLNGPIFAVMAVGISTLTVVVTAKLGRRIKNRKSDEEDKEIREKKQKESLKIVKKQEPEQSAQQQLGTLQNAFYDKFDFDKT